MDKFKGIAKGGWHPSGDRPIHRDTWKSDLKGVATGKKKDPYEAARNHESRPLSSLRDPDSFGPPPKSRAYHGDDSAASPSQTAGPSGGWGSIVPSPRPREQEQEQEEPPKPPEPYRVDTSGLRTDNLPKPPVRRVENGGGTGSPARTASPALPPRQTPTLPPRQAAYPPPTLPPRMNDHPDEFTPAPPPSYPEATQASEDAATVNQGAADRLGQAGVSVPGFGIGQRSAAPQQSPAGPSGPQLSELQQRFSRMNTGSQPQSSPLTTPVSAVAGKKPPPPPPKKSSLSSGSRPSPNNASPEPPPIPMASKPRPTG